MKRMRRIAGPVLGLTACLAALAPGVDAQLARMLEIGDRVRITPRFGETRTTGTVVSVAAEEIGIRASTGESRTFSTESFYMLERSLGHQSRVLAGAAVGGGIGFTLGAVTAAMLVPGLCGRASGCDDQILPTMTVLGVIVGAGGGLLGAILGEIASGERWEIVRLRRGPVIGWRAGVAGRGDLPIVGFSLTHR